ncbi:MAG: GspH/FimT family pseudopilin [Pseudomonadota bacterium]|nr:GspH/FimT family pseudopilin [Pseudomonadota bacterium]
MRKAPKGFTLIELLVTLAVAAIVVTMAVPSFQSMINGNRLTSAANEMIGSLQLARSEAMRRNARAGVCMSTGTNTGVDAACAVANVDGWITFVDVNDDGAYDDDDNDVLLRTFRLDGPIVHGLSADVGTNTVMFRPDGLARDQDSGAGPGSGLLDGTIRFCVVASQPTENARDVEIASGSRIASVRSDEDGLCPAP